MERNRLLLYELAAREDYRITYSYRRGKNEVFSRLNTTNTFPIELNIEQMREGGKLGKLRLGRLVN